MSLGGLLTTVLLVLAACLGFFYWWGHRPPTFDTTQPSIHNQYEITAKDSGKIFEYPETTRFTVYLDTTKYDVGKLACGDGGVVGQISDAPVVAPPLAAVRFEVVRGGSCMLRTGSFVVEVVGKSNFGI